MKKKECPSCAMEANARDKICPICGYEFAEYSTGFKWIAILLIILFILYFIF